MKSTYYQPECEHCYARLKSIFCDLNAAELQTLNAAKECGNYKKGQLIFHEGSLPHGVFCVNSGKIKISQTGDEGKEQIIRFSREGDVLGYRSLLSGDKYSSSATAIHDSNVCFIPRETFLSLLEGNSGLSRKLLVLLSNELKEAESKITHIAQKPVRERVAEALLCLKEAYGYEPDGATINVSLTREEIANIVGTTPESAIRLLSEFRRDNIIDLKGKKITFLNLPMLVKTANIFD